MHGRDGTNRGPAGETPSLEHGVLGPRPKQLQSSLPGSVGLVVGRSAAATTELVMMLVVLLLRWERCRFSPFRYTIIAHCKRIVANAGRVALFVEEFSHFSHRPLCIDFQPEDTVQLVRQRCQKQHFFDELNH